MADTSLIFSIIARDKTTGVLRKIQAQADSTGALMAKALGPALAPVAAVGTGAILGLGGALVAAGAAAGVFGAVVGTSMTAVTENATKVQDLRDKMELYGRQAQIMAAAGEDNSKMLKKQAAAALELKARMSLLAPEERRATTAFMDMKAGWKGFVDKNQPATFNTMANGYKLIGQVIGKLQPFFDIGRAAADRLLVSIQRMVDNGGIEKLAANAGPAMASLTSIIINVATALTRMFGKFTGQGQGVLNWIEKMTGKWAAWASSTQQDSGINKFFNYVSANGPQVAALLGSLASAAVNIAQAVTPLAPISLAIASALAALVAAVPPAFITTLVAGFLAFNVALKAYAVYQAIATAATWASNVALLANPITWIVLAIIALIAVIILIATKTTWFQTIWQHTWSFMKVVGAWFAGPFASFFVNSWNKIKASLNTAKNQFMTAFNFIKGLFLTLANANAQAVTKIVNGFGRVISFFRSAPGRIGGALRNMFSGLWSGFRGVVNKIIGGWNRLQFSIPGFSFAGMSVGGFSVGTPDIPYMRSGGHVREEGLAYIHRGETVTPAAKVTPYRGPASGQGATLTIKGDGSKTANLLLELLREAIRDKGGDPVKVLTAR